MKDQDIIRSCCENVYFQLGYGLSESAYQHALSSELMDYFSNIQCEYHINEYYTTTLSKKKIQISNLRIDILVNDNIILELKSISKLNNKEVLQIKRYKKLLDCEQAYLINFGTNDLEFQSI